MPIKSEIITKPDEGEEIGGGTAGIGGGGSGGILPGEGGTVIPGQPEIPGHRRGRAVSAAPKFVAPKF